MNLTTTLSYMLMFYGAYALARDTRRKFKDLWKKYKKQIHYGMELILG